MTLWLMPTVSRAADEPAGADTRPAVSPPARPRIGLVLSGGGARGAAHIGVLKVLDEMHVPIDAIAGTSMGAVVGGLYASGLTAREIEAVVSSVNWQNAFRDRPPRNELSFRRKQEDFSFLVHFPLGIRGGKLQLPQGLIEGQSLTLTLRQLTLPVARVQEFQDLPTPFRAVATDLTTGEPVVMRAGDLTTAMRASISAPGVFAPVERDGRLLVDGGIAENLPIDVAREMNVDVLIVVDVGAALYTRERLGTATSISNQMLAILIRRDSQRQLSTLSQRDVLVSPQLGEASSFDFGIVQRAIGAGELAARALESRLRALAVSPDAYASYAARRDAVRSNPPAVAFVRVAPDSQQYSVPLHSLFDDLIGKPLDADMTRRRVIDLYGRGNLAVLDYRVVPSDDEYGLDLTARRKSWGPNYVRFGLDLEDDFQGNAVYNAAARIVMSDMTRTGGEWVWDLQAGVAPHVYTEFFLPLSNAWTYFVLPHGQFIANNVPLIDSQGREIAEYRVRTWEYGLDFGRQFSNWAELRFGLLHDHGTSRVRVGDPNEPETQFTDYGYFVRVTYDQLDDVGFPRDGALATVQWNSEKSRINEVVESPFNQLTFNWILARSFGRETGVLWATYGTTLNQTAPLDVHTQYTLGGFLNLSGLPAQSLAGPNYGIARAIFYRKIGRGGEGFFDFPTYLGVSLEAGNVWQDRSDISWGSARKDASVFVGLDTLLGPLYLAYGYDYTGKEAFYLLLGHTF
ncbi:MAG TPA: patatin-like phospholipase family protein [Steroidobacteraceae bacterium]|nr:patatin-like phospholipase family protein [Steroidobacteraceae bacterium]